MEVKKMGVSKFVVYKLLLLEFHLQLACQSATASEHLGNCSSSSGIQANHNKCHTLQQQSTAKIVDIINVKTLVTNAQVKPTQKINYRAPISNNSSSDEVDESEFHFLITGGYRPVVNEIAKFLVSLRGIYPHKFFGDNHFCGGSIISRQAILSAAHCFFNRKRKKRPSQVRIFAGTPRRLLKTDKTQEMLVDTIKTHPKFDFRTLRNDVAVILIKGKLKTDGVNVDIIPIANNEPTIGAKCTVLGWGKVIQYGPSPDEVLNADVYIYPYRTCRRHLAFRKGMLCAGDPNDFEVDSCQGDSGGPLICDGRVAGIVSFGVGCGERGSFGVYTDVYYYRNWINNNRATHQKVNVLPTATFAISIITMQAFRI